MAQRCVTRAAFPTTKARRGTDESSVPVSLQAMQGGATLAVLLQAVTAWAESQRRKKLARIRFNTSSHRFFITTELSKELNCKLLGTEILIVFGGSKHFSKGSVDFARLTK